MRRRCVCLLLSLVFGGLGGEDWEGKSRVEKCLCVLQMLCQRGALFLLDVSASWLVSLRRKTETSQTMKRKLKKNKIVMRTIMVKKTPKQPRWVIDPETGEKISRTGLAIREIRKRGGILRVIDMDAVLE